METKQRKYYLEWWKVRKSTLYGLAGFIILGSAFAGGVWWAASGDLFSAIDTSEAPPDAARIISFEGDVRITRAASRETIVVNRETYAAAGDTIQTQSDGRAVVRMMDGSVYSVRPNSTVVIRDNFSLFGGRDIRVSLDDGQLNVKTNEQSPDGQNVVEMMDSETRLRSLTDASFNADSRSNSGEIRISRGSVETSIGGETTTISANEFAAVRDGRITAKEKLHSPPAQAGPENAAQVTDAGGGASVIFTWKDAGGSPASSYQLQVSKSAIFAPDALLVDRAGLTARDFRLNLVPGTYYWRLKSTSQSGQRSDWNEPWRFSVVRQEASRAIEVTDWKVERVGGNVFIVSGVTRAGILVRAQGRETFAMGDGSFRLQVSTPLSEVGIEFGDDGGNRAGYVLSLRTSRVLRRF